MTRYPIALVLLVTFGAMWSLASSVIVYNKWRIALHAGNYVQEEVVITSVEYWRHRKGSSIVGYGNVAGKRETIGLIDFGPYYRTQTALEFAYPKGTVLPIWYDPSAADIATQGSYLRILPRTYPLDRAFTIAITTTLKHNFLLLAGLCCCVVDRLRRKALGRPTRRQRSARKPKRQSWRR